MLTASLRMFEAEEVHPEKERRHWKLGHGLAAHPPYHTTPSAGRSEPVLCAPYVTRGRLFALTRGP